MVAEAWRAAALDLIVHAFDCVIGIRCECVETVARLDPFLLPAAPRGAGQVETWIGVARQDLRYRVNGGESLGFAELVVAVVRLVDDAVIAGLKQFAAVHAGVVRIGGRVLLLPGGTHAGKSTLVAALVAKGAIYFSDEYALVDGAGQVHPYARPMLLRESGREEQAPLLAPGVPARGPVPVGWVMEMRYASGWRLDAVPQSEGVLILLKNTPHVLAERPGILEALGRASACGQCFTGQRGEAGAAAEKILELCAI